MKKMNTPRELYLECLDDNMGKTPIPRICYKISMDSRTKAAQATINAFAKSYVKPVSKNSHGPYSDSDSSSCEDQVVSLPSLSLLRVFINGLPHFEPLHFGFYLNDDKNPSCLCPCVKGVTRWRELKGIAVWRDSPFHWHICICDLRVLLKGNICCVSKECGVIA